MVDMNMKVVEPRKLTPESRFRFRCHPGKPLLYGVLRQNHHYPDPLRYFAPEKPPQNPLRAVSRQVHPHRGARQVRPAHGHHGYAPVCRKMPLRQAGDRLRGLYRPPGLLPLLPHRPGHPDHRADGRPKGGGGILLLCPGTALPRRPGRG